MLSLRRYMTKSSPEEMSCAALKERMCFTKAERAISKELVPWIVRKVDLTSPIDSKIRPPGCRTDQILQDRVNAAKI